MVNSAVAFPLVRHDNHQTTLCAAVMVVISLNNGNANDTSVAKVVLMGEVLDGRMLQSDGEYYYHLKQSLIGELHTADIRVMDDRLRSGPNCVISPFIRTHMSVPYQCLH